MEQEGITHHGRVPQSKMREWIEKCGVWAYPTHFGEISCLSAMKAQAFGAMPVVINYESSDNLYRIIWLLGLTNQVLENAQRYIY